MLTKSKAIVLHYLKYTDNSIIVHFFTRENGRLSCIVSGIKKKKNSSKTAYFYPLNILNINYYYKQSRNLQRLQDVSPFNCLNIKQLSYVKSSIAVFIAEFLSKILKEEEKNEKLFSFIENALNFFELDDDQLANFHLVFLLNLTKYIGIYPNNNYSPLNNYFNILLGSFVSDPNLLDNLNKEESKLLNQLLICNFETMNQVKMSGKSRANLLNIIIKYCHSHLAGLGAFKSLDILKTLF